MRSSSGVFSTTSERNGHAGATALPPAAPPPTTGDASTPARSARSLLASGLKAATLLLSLGAATACALAYLRHLQAHPGTDNAYVQADLVRVTARVSAPLRRMELRDNQEVKRGDLLFDLDPDLLQAAVDQAQAAVVTAEQNVLAYEEDVRRTASALVLTRQNQERSELPVSQARHHQQDLDAQNDALTQTQANHVRAQNTLRAPGQENGALLQARANLELARLNLSFTRVLAPVDGPVTNLNLPPGNYVTAGQPLFIQVDARSWRVLAYFKETQVERMRPGQPVTVRLFSYPGRTFRGVVQGIGWGIFQSDGSASATTAQLPSVSPTVNWVRLAQRFPVRIDLSEVDVEHPFRVGQTAVVQVDATGEADSGRGRPRR